ncbi:MAG: hypothetical protein KKF48_03935 [Nanoarchaeota archaeon]|nr:hypothetical protein [Nanoarchaeota archaeon]MBU1028168.1 hypothetical protein [Nanoarchaeota archaeon]
MIDPTIIKITGLALADSVNPCALAVLLLILVAILIQDPGKRSRVLFGGLTFVFAIYIGYIFFGFALVTLWKTASIFLRSISGTIYKLFGILAMILGALQIKDFLYYRKGGIGTEMPLTMRPKVKKIIEKVTSAKGAFIAGLIVTIFLLPCTIGPYIVASGVLSDLTTIEFIPWLLYYNFIFVIPMLGVTLAVYIGSTTIKEVEYWKKKNIRILHLIAGILLFLIGLSLLMGWL